jgi:hypothetical protein
MLRGVRLTNKSSFFSRDLLEKSRRAKLASLCAQRAGAQSEREATVRACRSTRSYGIVNPLTNWIISGVPVPIMLPP